MIFSRLNSKRYWTAFSYRTFFTVCFCIGAQTLGKCFITWFILRFCRRKSQIQNKFQNLQTVHAVKTKETNVAVHIQKNICWTGRFASTFDALRIFQLIWTSKTRMSQKYARNLCTKKWNWNYSKKRNKDSLKHKVLMICLKAKYHKTKELHLLWQERTHFSTKIQRSSSTKWGKCRWLKNFILQESKMSTSNTAWHR